MVSRRSSDKLTYHTNTGAKGVRWEVAPEFSLHNTRVTMRAGYTAKAPLQKLERHADETGRTHPQITRTFDP